MRVLAVSAILLALAGCAGNEEPSSPPSWSTPAPPPVVAIPVPVPTETAPRDACGAYELQYLVGRMRSEIPVPVQPSKRRVACTTCPVTQDYREDRLNIFFDAETGVIKEVKCG